MSRYGNLVKTEGHSKYFLTNTLAEHDDTMDHPFMKQIYDCSLSQEHLSRYLAGQYWMFAALEAAVGPRKAEPLLAPVYDAALERAASLDADLRYHCGRNWQKSEALRPEAAGSAQLREMLAQLAADAAADDGGERLMVHHFLQYNAVLSGGQYLKRMLNQKLELPASNKEGVSFFCFPGVPTATRVRTYLEVQKAKRRSSFALSLNVIGAFYNVIRLLLLEDDITVEHAARILELFGVIPEVFQEFLSVISASAL